jgi:hypothetical protein
VTETDQLAQDASVAPGRVLPGHPQYRRPHGCCDGRAAGLSARVGPAAGDQLGVPAQQGPGWDEPQAAQRGWVSPWQRGTKPVRTPRANDRRTWPAPLPLWGSTVAAVCLSL